MCSSRKFGQMLHINAYQSSENVYVYDNKSYILQNSLSKLFLIILFNVFNLTELITTRLLGESIIRIKINVVVTKSSATA